MTYGVGGGAIAIVRYLPVFVRDEDEILKEGGATDGGFEYFAWCLFFGITVELDKDSRLSTRYL